MAKEFTNGQMEQFMKGIFSKEDRMELGRMCGRAVKNMTDSGKVDLKMDRESLCIPTKHNLKEVLLMGRRTAKGKFIGNFDYS